MASLNLSGHQANSTASLSYGYYVPLLVPVILFLGSLYIPPMVRDDSGVGFFALRTMLAGGAFNCITMPDPANIANDLVTFQAWFSPGQYLVPGSFIWLGTNYGLALSLTALTATLIGVAGWIQVGRSAGASSFVLFIFVLGLSTFPYVTWHFHGYHGGELLLFATAPWSLYAMRWATKKPPILCFAISVLSAAMLFFAKLTGLIVFATNVGAISVVSLLSQRRLSSSIIAMWVASVIAALCFVMFWVSRGAVPARPSTFTFSWFPIWFSVAAAVFSGIYSISFLFGHSWLPINSEWATELLGPLGLLLMVWVWLRLRHTRYQETALLFLMIILMYAIVLAAMYLMGSDVGAEERHFRYAGILSFLVLLLAIDHSRVPLAKRLTLIVVVLLGLYGLRTYTTFAYAQVRANYYDPMSGISQDIVSPGILEYLRSDAMRHDVKRPVAVIPSASAAISLPGFRIIYIPGHYQTLEMIAAHKWAGRVEKIYVVVQEEMVPEGKAEAILRSFSDYEFGNWGQMKLDGMVIYTQ